MLNILELDDGHDRVEYTQLNHKPCCNQKKETEQTSNLWMDIDHTNGRVSQLCMHVQCDTVSTNNVLSFWIRHHACGWGTLY